MYLEIQRTLDKVDDNSVADHKWTRFIITINLKGPSLCRFLPDSTL